MVTNGGKKAFNEIGEYGLFPIEAHSNIHSMANIVSLKIWTMFLESESQWIAQRSVQLQWSTKEKFTSSRSSRTGYTIMTLQLTNISPVQPINIIPQILLICS